MLLPFLAYTDSVRARCYCVDTFVQKSSRRQGVDQPFAVSTEQVARRLLMWHM